MNERLLIEGPTSAAHADIGRAPMDVPKCAPAIVIGGGPVGIRVAQEISRLGSDCIILNAERWLPYNRVKLSTLLAGDAQIGQMMQPLGFPGPGRVLLYSDHSVIDVDRAAHTVTVKSGRRFDYSKLIFCTGSRAHIPPIPGRELPGVFTFRNADDAEKLIARSLRSRSTIVIGGGLLGLEAARGMANRGIETCVVEHGPYLMPRQLDQRAGRLLAERIERLGIKIRTGASVASIYGDQRVEGIALQDGAQIACDTVIVCTGIRANIELAREIALPVGRGIRVDAGMCTQDPDIYAAGECCEFEENVYGLIGPGFEQAVVAAHNIAGEPRAYSGSVPVTKLKVIGVDVFSMGDVEQLDQRSDVRQIRFEDAEKNSYRSIVLRRSKIIGAMAIGDWDEINRVQEAIQSGTTLYPWQIYRFRRSGQVWPQNASASVREWPRATTVCNCTGVTRGQIGDAISAGAATLDDVKRDTGASTVCGSCRVNIEALLGAPAPRQPVAAYKPLLALAAAACVIALLILSAPRIPFSQTISGVGFRELLWIDDFWKQVSGYSLLAFTVLAAGLSLRKRVRALAFGAYDIWRVIHAAIAAGAILTLVVHTGLRLGSNLNLWLMTSFLTAMLSGAAFGALTAAEHRLPTKPTSTGAMRNAVFWLHLIALWPLPLLIAVHVLTVYFY